MLSAISRLNPHVDMKKIVIGLMDRLSTYAQRESDGSSAGDKQKGEEEATRRMLEKIRLDKESKPETKSEADSTAQGNGTETDPMPEAQQADSTPADGDKSVPGLGDVKLYEIFYEQVISLVKTRGLSIQDTMALLTSLANLAL